MKFGEASGSAENSRPHLRGCLRSLKALTSYLADDLYRYCGTPTFQLFVKHFMFVPGYKTTVWMRVCGYLKAQPILRYTLYPLAKWRLLACRYKYGIVIPEYTEVGPGLFINRFGGIYIHGDAVIGRNVNITHGVVLGYSNRGKRAGAPVIGDEVFLGSGAKIVGRVHVGNGCAIGVNAVVAKDIPANSVVVAPEGVVISSKGSEGYINRKAGYR